MILTIGGLEARDALVVGDDLIATEQVREHFTEIEYVDTSTAVLFGAATVFDRTDQGEITAHNEQIDGM